MEWTGHVDERNHDDDDETCFSTSLPMRTVQAARLQNSLSGIIVKLYFHLDSVQQVVTNPYLVYTNP